MNPPDNDFIAFAKDWIFLPAVALVGWAWKHNQKEHDMLRESHEKLSSSTHVGQSTLNDKMMEYVDSAISEAKDDQRRRSDKLANHIERLFQNAEEDRKEFSRVMADHREDSYKRHIELLHAINAKADK
jgi:hypothetical protein